MTENKSNFDIIYEQLRTDPKFFEALCKNPEKAINKSGVELTEGEKAVVALLKNNLVKGQSPAQLQSRMSAKGSAKAKVGEFGSIAGGGIEQQMDD